MMCPPKVNRGRDPNSPKSGSAPWGVSGWRGFEGVFLGAGQSLFCSWPLTVDRGFIVVLGVNLAIDASDK